MQYFATLPTDEITGALQQRIDDFRQYLKTSGRLTLWKRVYGHMFKADSNKGSLYNTGKQGEYTNVDIADLRNIATHLKVLTTNQQPAFEPRATNTDTKSLAQTILAGGLLDYYQSEQRLDRHATRATEWAIGYGDGYFSLDWDATAGEDYATNPDGSIVRDGELVAKAHHPINVTMDVCRPTNQGHTWFIVQEFENRWDLAAKYAGKNKELAERISSVAYTAKDDEQLYAYPQLKSNDIVPVYTFRHDKTPACPQGRVVKFLPGNIVLSDGPLPFKGLAIFRISPGEQDGSPFGWSIVFDLLPIQEAVDKLCSVILTNQATHGVGNVLIPEGANVSVTSLADGLNGIIYNAAFGEIKALNLTATPAEIFKFVEMLRNIMQVLSGVNSVARGEPDASLKSGAALALVQSMAIQFNSDLQRAYSNLMADVGTGVIQILQQFARTKRVAMIVGKSNKSSLRQWDANDINMVQRVTVNLGNPLIKTTGGKIELAKDLLSAGFVKTAEQYIQVLTTGKLEPMYEGDQAELQNIRSENEALSEGQSAQAVITDRHSIHVREHKCVLASPEARTDPGIVDRTVAHIQEHINMLRSADPALLALIGEQAAPPLPPPVPDVNPKAINPGPVAAGGPVTEPGPQARMPQMPTNPMTGDKFQPMQGAMP